MGTSDRVTKVPERVNPCRADALRCLECEEELGAGFKPGGGLTAWDWVKISVGAALACGLFWVMAAGWPLLSVIGGGR